MIWVIKTKINDKLVVDRFYNKGNAVEYYRLKVRELAFPDTITVDIFNDGEDNA